MSQIYQGEFFKNTIRSLENTAEKFKIDPNIMARLKTPRRSVVVSIPVRMDDYSVKVFEGYRVQHNSSLGPFKGGIRYHESVTVGDTAALAALMTFKASLLQLPLGGAKGGVKVDATKLSKTEIQNLTRRYTTEISPFIGPNEDIPAPDVGTDAQTMAWMMDTYSQESGFAQPGVVTGKPIEIGGSIGRESATGNGVVYVAIEALKRQQKDIKGTTFAIQGFGKVGLHAASSAFEKGAKIIAVSDVTGAFYNPEGLPIPEMIEYVKEKKSLAGFPNASAITNEELLALEVEVLCPCALSGVINDGNCDQVKAKIIVEGANGPVTSEASQVLSDRGVCVIPDILANGGGVIVSYFEWVQGIAAYFWDGEEVERKLRDVITKAFDNVWTFSEAENVNMRMAALGVSMKRLERAMLLRGLYPR